MSRLEKYRFALLAAFPEVSSEKLNAVHEGAGPDFAEFVVDHGLGPTWHERTGRQEYYASRMTAEALYAVQEPAIAEIRSLLQAAGIEFAVIKGAANRLRLYENPALRACYDIDLLIRRKDRISATSVLVDAGFDASPAAHRFNVELLLTRGVVDIDLHWRLVRKGRLRRSSAASLLSRCATESVELNPNDGLFVLLVHPAFAKHLSGWDMGLHRVMDIIVWLQTQEFDWPVVRRNLQENGVSSAAWATLRWVQLLSGAHAPANLDAMIADMEPGWVKRNWIDQWLRRDLSTRLSKANWSRNLGFSLLLHDTARDAWRAVVERQRSSRNVASELAEFEKMLGQ